MESWPAPEIPVLPGRAALLVGAPPDPATAPRLFDSATQQLVAAVPADGASATLYVCGITPYDATHLGHAATYLAFDTLQRVWRDAGYTVRYAQNTTDVDDPLLERAARDGVDWRELAAEQVQLFRDDMAALRVIPPDDYVAVTDVIEPIADAVALLRERGLAYEVPTADSVGEAPDLYLSNQAVADSSPWTIGSASSLPPELMPAFFADHGGDPERPGKRDPLDALLWRAERLGEPSWPSAVGRGRPGWHIECAVIATRALGPTITVQGGGRDLTFPHHDLGAGHASALTGRPFARLYAHSGMVALDGEKMSKSLGNLVLVSQLLADGVDPRAIRLAVLAHHYRADWEWSDSARTEAERRLRSWSAAAESPRRGAVPADASSDALPTPAGPELMALRAALRDDLDTPQALAIIDAAAATGSLPPELIAAADALLGIRLPGN